MAKRTIAVRLQGLLGAITIAQKIASGHRRDNSEFRDRPAMEGKLEFISKASRYIPSEYKSRHRAIPWRAIAAIGNKLRDEYQHFDEALIWQIAITELEDPRRTVTEKLS